MSYTTPHYYPKYEIWTIEKKMVNNPLKVIKGNLRDLSDLERSLCQTLYSATSRKGRESDTQKSKAAVDRARWEQQSCRGAAQQTAVDLKAIIVRLMDGVGSYRKSAISQIARFDVNFTRYIN